MDPRFLDYYERELAYIREMGREFAQAYPAIGARLDLESLECADPYVERLLEGFAFLTARIQLKMDAEFPGFIHHLLEAVYPHFLTPVPTMAVLGLTPDLENIPPQGYELPAHSRLFALADDRHATRVELRTGQPLRLWPLRIEGVRYLPPGSFTPRRREARARLEIDLAGAGGLPLAQLQGLDELQLHFTGSGALPWRLYELLGDHCIHLEAKSPQAPPSPLPPPRPVGLEADEALLPLDPRVFSGYRLLQEYFALPERFRSLRIAGLARPLARCAQGPLTLAFELDKEEDRLDRPTLAENVHLHAVPVINLFPKRCDRIFITPGKSEFPISVDRSRPHAYEIHSLLEVEGFADGPDPVRRFTPLYGFDHQGGPSDAFYSLRRRHRQGSDGEAYPAVESLLALVDRRAAPWHPDLRQIGVTALCTNRDLCRRLRPQADGGLFTLDSGAPILGIELLAGPSRPRPVFPDGEWGWRLVGHLAVNQTPLTDLDALRALLGLYVSGDDARLQKQIQGITALEAQGVVARLPGEGPPVHARGTRLRLRFDPRRYPDTSPRLLGRIIEAFLQGYAPINSFVQVEYQEG